MIPHSQVTVWLLCPNGPTQFIPQNLFLLMGDGHRAGTAIIPILGVRRHGLETARNLPMATQLVGGWVRVKTRAGPTPKPRLWATTPGCPKWLPPDSTKWIRNMRRLHRALKTPQGVLDFVYLHTFVFFLGRSSLYFIRLVWNRKNKDSSGLTITLIFVDRLPSTVLNTSHVLNPHNSLVG